MPFNQTRGGHASQRLAGVLEPKLENEISFRLSAHAFPFTTIAWAPIHQVYERREAYKRAGAIYNGTSKQWSMLLGSNIHQILTLYPEWLEGPGILKPRMWLRMMEELEHHPILRCRTGIFRLSRARPALLCQQRIEAT